MQECTKPLHINNYKTLVSRCAATFHNCSADIIIVLLYYLSAKRFTQNCIFFIFFIIFKKIIDKRTVLVYNNYCCADVAQLAEHYIGSVEVTSSTLVISSKNRQVSLRGLSILFFPCYLCTTH